MNIYEVKQCQYPRFEQRKQRAKLELSRIWLIIQKIICHTWNEYEKSELTMVDTVQ